MDFEEKTVWKTPELIVLVRSKPEEAVLAGCKTSSEHNPNTSAVGCRKNKGCQNFCNVIGSS